jgi:hypothetical protein
MSAVAALFMVLICGVVWGGFGFLLVRMARSERKKSGPLA